jgi:hypothetical protein
MPKSKKLHQKIEKKLDQLQTLIDEINEVQNLNSDDPETWDSDTLYNLVENLKETLKLLEDKTHPKQKDSFGEPLILEVGLCSLLDEYHADEEETLDD